MNLLIKPDGSVHCIYAEEIDLAQLGNVEIKRASHVEPDARGRWWVHIRLPSLKRTLGPFLARSQAIASEVRHLTAHLFSDKELPA